MNENQSTKGQIFEKPNANAVGAHDCARINNNKLTANVVGVAAHSDPHSRGITLVALIITIIIMLILVAVSITIVIKGNLFGIAKSGVKGMTIEAYKENLEAIRVNAMMEQIKNNLTTVGFMDKVEEGITANKVFEKRQSLKKTSKSVKVTTKEGYLFKITENKVTYMGLASEQGELTINLSKENTDFIYKPEGWSKGPVEVAIETRVDAEEVGAILEYSVDGGTTWQEYTKPVKVEDNGVTIKARLYSKEEDETGTDVEETVTDKIDRLNPKQFTPTGTSTDSSITLTGSTEDSEASSINGSSGIKAYYYSIDNGTTWLPQNGTQETSYTFTGLPDTTTYTTLKMRAVDNAGNEVITEAITVATKKVNKPYVGDYVNYTPQSEVTSYNVEAIYSGYTSDQEIKQDTNKVRWRILNINDDRTIDLISDKPIGNLVRLDGALGYNNGVYLLNEVCKTLYSNSKYEATARSINIEDIQNKMDLTLWDYHDYSNGVAKYGEAWTFSASKRGAYPYQWTNEKSGKNAIDRELIATGTLGKSEQYQLTKETFSRPSEFYTVEMTGWNCTDYDIGYISGLVRDAGHDRDVMDSLILGSTSAGYFWVASRFSGFDQNFTRFGLFIAGHNQGGTLDEFNTSHLLYLGDSETYDSEMLRPVVKINKSYLNLSENYEETGVWNLKP